MSMAEAKQKRAIKRLCFTGEDGRVYRLAEGVRCGDESARVELGYSADPRFLRRVADALEGTTQFQPTPTRLHIVKAWHQASVSAARNPSGGMDIDAWIAGPTRAQVTAAFVKLFGQNACPTRQSISKTLKLLNLPLSKGKVGRPQNNSHPTVGD